MTFGFPLGLLGLISLPLIFLIHFFVKKRKRKKTSALFLWRDGRFSREMSGGRKYTLPPLTISLFLELLAALCLSLLMADLRWEETIKIPHLVVILDDSASMQALDGGERLRDRAVNKLKKILQKYPSSLRLSLVLTGPIPQTLAVFTPLSRALKTLPKWNPLQRYHSPLPALALAREIAGKKARLLFLTDHLPPDNDWFAGVEIRSVGRPLNNLAITSFHGSPQPRQTRVTVIVENFSPKGQETTLKIKTASEKTLYSQSLQLKKGEKKLITFFLPSQLKKALITLPPDGLLLDNQAYLVVPPKRTLLIYNGLSGASEAFFHKAFQVVPFVKWTGDSSQAHLIFFPFGAKIQAGLTGRVVFVGPVGKKKASLLAPFVIAQNEELMKYTNLDGVIWTAGVDGDFTRAYPFLTAGKIPLYYEKQGRYYLNLSLEHSNLVKSPDWPILCYNLAEWTRRELPGLNTYNARAGQQVRGSIALLEEEESLFLAQKGKKLRNLYLGEFINFQAPQQAGFYQLRTENRLLSQWSVNLLDSRESDLSALSQGTRKAVHPVVETPVKIFEKRKLHSGLLLLLLVFLLMDWWILAKYT